MLPSLLREGKTVLPRYRVLLPDKYLSLLRFSLEHTMPIPDKQPTSTGPKLKPIRQVENRYRDATGAILRKFDSLGEENADCRLRGVDEWTRKDAEDERAGHHQDQRGG